MNRLVRTALTLFASSSVMIFIVLKRLEGARHLVGKSQESELQMVYLGMGITAVMLVIGVGLMVTAFLRSRKAKSDPANHG
ncbi:MAG TPA: hypothetical protein VGE67_14910 [Haloferula sp.]